MGNKFIIGNTLVSESLLTGSFCCNVAKCLAACCIEGDAGAPLEKDEVPLLEEHLGTIKEYMSSDGIASVEKSGVYELDMFKCLVTPLINGKECAYTVFRNGLALCAVELAWEAGRIPFRKPVSCHLYPVRIGRSSHVETVNVHRWYVCKDAWKLGAEKKMPLYVFLKEALIRKFGAEWYSQLLLAAGLRKSDQ